jgi:hypothetical protein
MNFQRGRQLRRAARRARGEYGYGVVVERRHGIATWEPNTEKTPPLSASDKRGWGRWGPCVHDVGTRWQAAARAASGAGNRWAAIAAAAAASEEAVTEAGGVGWKAWQTVGGGGGMWVHLRSTSRRPGGDARSDLAQGAYPAQP